KPAVATFSTQTPQMNILKLSESSPPCVTYWQALNPNPPQSKVNDMRVLIIDNYDSFTYNLYQYIGEILSSTVGYGHFEVQVKRNNEMTLEQIRAWQPDRIIISPGPGSPDDRQYFGVCSEAILELGKTIP